MRNQIKIILADSQELFRSSLNALLSTNADLHVMTEVNNGRELIDELKSRAPDIVIMDSDMPVMDGRATLDVIQRRFPSIKVIVLTENKELCYISDYMALGAACFLTKCCGVSTLIQAIRSVHKEGYYFDQIISKELLNSLVRSKRNNGAISEEVNFSVRETDIMRRICDGHTNKHIASDLHISPSTVDFYRSKIYAKAKCANVAELIKYAVRSGLVVLI
jgi:DNA-binding NarL/FixJ family response regulator